MDEVKRPNTVALWKVHVALVVVQVGYGGSYVLSKVALATGVTPIVFAVYRDIVCLAVLVPIAYLTERRKRVPLTTPTVIQLVGLGFFGAFITQLLVLYGLTLTSAAYASTVSVLTPLFTFIISTSLGYEQIRWRRKDGQAKLFGLVSAVFGAVILGAYMGPVILGHAETGIQTITPTEIGPKGLIACMLSNLKIGPWHLGILFLFLAGLTLSISISIQVPILARYPAPLSVSAFAYVFGAIMLFTTSLITNEGISAWVISQMSAVISILYNGLIPAALNFSMLIWCVQKSGPVLVGAYIPLQLFSSAAMAYIFLGEGIHLGCVLGTLLIINGLSFITWGQVRSRHLEVRAVTPLDSTAVITSTPNLEEPLLG